MTRSPGPVFDRRDFLTLTSTGLAAFAVGGLGAAAQAPESAGKQATVEPLSVGYVDGSDRLADLRQPSLAGRPARRGWCR